MPVNQYLDWLRAGLKRPGKSQAALAKATGLNTSVVSRIVAGKRPMRDNEIELIARYLGDEPPSVRADEDHKVVMAPVQATVQENAWIEEPTQPKTKTQEYVACLAIDAFEPGDQYALELLEPSNRFGQVDREYLICVPIEALDRKLRPRDCVHVEIQHSESRLKQVLVREVRASEDRKLELVALDPALGKKPIPLTSAIVKGFVVGRYTRYRT